MVKAAKNERLDVRLSKRHKELIERAAATAGQPVSSFAVAALVARAQDILQREQATQLSDADRKAFLKLFDNPKPNAALKKAANRYKSARG